MGGIHVGTFNDCNYYEPLGKLRCYNKNNKLKKDQSKLSSENVGCKWGQIHIAYQLCNKFIVS